MSLKNKSLNKYPPMVTYVPILLAVRKTDALKKKKLANKEQAVNDMINNRMTEIKKMCNRRRGRKNKINIEELPEDVQNYIITLTKIPSHVYRENTKKSFTRKIDLFRNVARTVLIMIKYYMSTRRMFLDRWLENYTDDGSNFGDIEKMKVFSIRQLHEGKSALTSDAIFALRTIPELRTKSQVNKILWIIKRLSVFDLVIPHDMMPDLAAVMTYQRLENGRIIANESDEAQRLYFILSGKIKLVKKFDLSSGELYKVVGFMNEGDTTDPEEVERGWLREHTMIAKGNVELFVVEKKDLYKLRFHYHNLPIEFLKGIDLFTTYPFESLMQNNETVMYQYYGPNQVINRDAEDSPWLYVVKSGSIRVVKKLKVFDIDKQPKTPSFYYLKPYSIVPTLPSQIISSNQVTSVLKAEKLYDSYTKPQTADNNMMRKRSLSIQPRFDLTREATLPPIKLMNSKIDDSSITFNSDTNRTETEYVSTSILKNNKEGRKASKHSIGTKNKPETPKSAKNPYKTSHVVVDTLDEGSIFGLNKINDAKKTTKKFRSELDVKKESDKIILISEGSELILLSKRSFITYADVDTICKVEKLIHPFAGEEQARNLLFQGEKWKAYKKNLLNTLVTHSIDVL